MGDQQDFHDVTDWDIQALVDNELDWERRKRVQRFVEADRQARARHEELVLQKKALQRWWTAIRKH